MSTSIPHDIRKSFLFSLHAFSFLSMTNASNQSGRRILSFPAVHPCEGVSPAALLASLISLSQAICSFQSKFFPTQRRNSREIIRQLGIILLFFEEIRDRGVPISDSVALCFSELHLCLQKIHFLLSDCTREGARLWMLMKSEHVATQFRVLTRALATALDVLPLSSIEICDEVKEVVELVAKQAQKVKLELDPHDEHATTQVLSVLNQFERGMEPNLSIMKRTLNYLGIKNWNDCNKEIKFLEDEVNFNSSEGDEGEVPFLSNLVGYLCYCRVAIFETLDFQQTATDPSETRCSTEMINFLNPQDFRCPISLQLMADPVTLSTGQTYDRASIQKWLKAGNRTCPKTGEKLTNTELVPNTTLRKLIHQFCADNGVSTSKSGHRSRDITRTSVPGSTASAHAMQFLSWFIARRLVFGTDEQKNKAAYEIRVLARSNIFNRACLIEVGTVPSLLNLLDTNDKSTQENAISALLKLAKHTNGQKTIMESDGLTPILTVLKNGISLEARQTAAAIIFYLSSTKENRKIIGENPEAIPALVELIKEETTALGKKNATVAIFGLLLLPQNHQKVLEANAVPALVNILSSSEKSDLTTDCLAVLAALAENVEGAKAVSKACALPLIVGMLQKITWRTGKEHCVAILMSLCVHVGEEVVSILAKDPSLMPWLYSLLTDGTSHAAKKARSLIKLLHEYNDTRTSQWLSSSVLPERSLHIW
ncbi:U-box domain-containing protein 19-like [Neltuma alba]|uniref:U-box domain-containing protein 19-like n=1 Tax=Neltuma alba TaxID=207710 RepID=UPI0010A446D9|nr:U-box domain-containing protein 19-like [Prosopis alba]